MKAIRIFQKRGMKGEFPLIPEASSTDVREVGCPVREQACDEAGYGQVDLEAPQCFEREITRKGSHDTHGDNVGAEGAQAPMGKEERLDQERDRGDRRRYARAQNIPEIPVPHGCEHVPAVGTGMGMHERMKTTAAMSPTRGLKERSTADIFLSL